MSDLLHDDRPAAEARLLCTVSLELQSLARIGDVMCGDRGVVRDLFYYEVRPSAAVFVWPVAVEESE